KIGEALLRAWEAMVPAELEPALADGFGAALADRDLPGRAGGIAFRLALLTPDYETAAQKRQPADADEAFLIAVARGATAGVTPPDPIATAVAEGFAAEGAPLRVRALVDEKRTGEAILRAMDLVTLGATGQLDELSDG